MVDGKKRDVGCDSIESGVIRGLGEDTVEWGKVTEKC